MWKPDRIEARQAGNGPLTSDLGKLSKVGGTERAVTDLKSGSTRSVQTSFNNFLQYKSRMYLRDLADFYPALKLAITTPYAGASESR